MFQILKSLTNLFFLQFLNFKILISKRRFKYDIEKKILFLLQFFKSNTLTTNNKFLINLNAGQINQPIKFMENSFDPVQCVLRK